MSTEDVIYEHEKIGKITQSHVLIQAKSYNLSEIGKAEYVSLFGTKLFFWISSAFCLAFFLFLAPLPIACWVCLKGKIDIYNKNGAKIGTHTFYVLSFDAIPVEEFAHTINRNIKS